ncbi:transposase [Patescibacteria group bacterium]|nr:transposase [Patescibacteria group bacterium]
MPRKLREKISFPGALYHVVCRGVNEGKIFKRSPDYNKILKILRKAKEKFNFSLYSYSLMPNHVHFQIKTKSILIPQIMHYINFCYAIYFNHKHKRSGHLFQDRYYASLVDSEFYFWALSAYIDLNPVRAGLVERPEDYKWGSYQFCYQKNLNNDLVDCLEFLEMGGEGNAEELCDSYLNFVKEEAKNPKRPKFIKSEKFT